MKRVTTFPTSKRYPTLARLLAPVHPAYFLAECFEKRPLFVKGRSGKFSHLLTPDRFKLGLDRVTEIRAVFEELRQASIDPADIKDMFEAGATICVTGMERAHKTLLNAAARLKRELGYGGGVSFRAYLSPPGEGFDIHFDARIATTLQIAGSKRWWYSETPAVAFPDFNSPRDPKELRSEFRVPRLSGLKSVVLKPGDFLCLPAGTWHRAKSDSGCLALNLAFDHVGGSVFDVIIAALEEELLKDPQWRRPLPVGRGTASRIPDQALKVLQSKMGEMASILGRIQDDRESLRQAWVRSFTDEDR
jgi:ribosomal protein L16 Arg81 hydroxylase